MLKAKRHDDGYYFHHLFSWNYLTLLILYSLYIHFERIESPESLATTGLGEYVNLIEPPPAITTKNVNKVYYVLTLKLNLRKEKRTRRVQREKELPSLSTKCGTIIINEVIQHFPGRWPVHRHPSLPDIIVDIAHEQIPHINNELRVFVYRMPYSSWTKSD